MGMEIKINASDLLKVLVNSGMDATDAKAIIYDLLQYPEGQLPERRKLKDVKKQRMRKKIIEVPVDDEDVDGDVDDGGEEEYEDDEEDEDDEDVMPTKIRKPKRINFSSFGGPAQAIQPKKG